MPLASMEEAKAVLNKTGAGMRGKSSRGAGRLGPEPARRGYEHNEGKVLLSGASIGVTSKSVEARKGRRHALKGTRRDTALCANLRPQKVRKGEREAGTLEFRRSREGQVERGGVRARWRTDRRIRGIPGRAVGRGRGRHRGRGRAGGERRSGEESHGGINFNAPRFREDMAVLFQPKAESLDGVGPAFGNFAMGTAAATPSPGGSPGHPVTREGEGAARRKCGLDRWYVRSRVLVRRRGRRVRERLGRAKSRQRGRTSPSRAGGGRRARGRGLTNPYAPQRVHQASKTRRKIEPKQGRMHAEPENTQTIREFFDGAGKSARGPRARAPTARAVHEACRERAQHA